jgi:hypothetical protein
VKIEFVFHKTGERDQFAELTWPVCPRDGENIIFNDATWKVREVTYDLELQRIQVIASR